MKLDFHSEWERLLAQIKSFKKMRLHHFMETPCLFSRRNQQQLFQSCLSSSADTFIASPRPLLAGLGSKDPDSRGAGQGITWGSGLLGGAGWPDKGSLLSTRGWDCVPCAATPPPGAFGFVNDISRDRLCLYLYYWGERWLRSKEMNQIRGSKPQLVPPLLMRQSRSAPVAGCSCMGEWVLRG